MRHGIDDSLEHCCEDVRRLHLFFGRPCNNRSTLLMLLLLQGWRCRRRVPPSPPPRPSWPRRSHEMRSAPTPRWPLVAVRAHVCCLKPQSLVQCKQHHYNLPVLQAGKRVTPSGSALPRTSAAARHKHQYTKRTIQQRECFHCRWWCRPFLISTPAACLTSSAWRSAAWQGAHQNLVPPGTSVTTFFKLWRRSLSSGNASAVAISWYDSHAPLTGGSGSRP
jgi:hypothetical protein